MSTYTVSVTGAGALAPRFEQMLDVLDQPALVGSEETAIATLYFDVKARDGDGAIERAFLAVESLLRPDEVTFSIARTSTVAGRRIGWIARLLGI